MENALIFYIYGCAELVLPNAPHAVLVTACCQLPTMRSWSRELRWTLNLITPASSNLSMTCTMQPSQ
jgi:hypothetical protein